MKVTIFKVEPGSTLVLPYIESGIRAGFPSPAQDYISESIDLNKVLIKNPSATFLGRVEGDSLYEDDLEDGDLIVIDRSLTPEDEDLAVCCINGEFTLKYISLRKDHIILNPANENYPPICVDKNDDFTIWGIVPRSILDHRNKRRTKRRRERKK